MNDGGPAFPRTPANALEHWHAGMSLRDHFAGQALVGILACFRDHTSATTKKLRAELAYEYADEMLQAREKQ